MPHAHPAPHRRATRRAAAALVLTLALASPPPPAAAQPVAGFVEDFATTTSSWSGGAVFSNPGTGGLDGPADGYLDVRTFAPGHLGTFSGGVEYVGDWLAAGITHIRLHVRDTGSAGALELHFGIGNGDNVWQYDVGFVPVAEQWTEFVVDLTDSASFTQTIGAGSFAAALQNADRIRIRHDLAPFVQLPDPSVGAFGLDHVVLGSGTVSVPGAPGWARALELAPPRPNPARGAVTMAFRAARPGPVSFEVYDAGGRRLRREVVPVTAPGNHAWRWDGRGSDGARVPPGVYRVRAAAGDERTARSSSSGVPTSGPER